MNETKYKSNEEPKIGDRVRLQNTPELGEWIVETVLGGRLGNKLGVRNVDQPGWVREYYYNCFVKIG